MFYIEIIKGPKPLVGNKFFLKKDKVLLGRARFCDLSLPDPKISGRHLLLINKGNQVDFQDQNSTNGTFFDGTRTAEGTLKNNDSLVLGECEIRLVQEQQGLDMVKEENEQELNLSERSLGFSVVSHKNIEEEQKTGIGFLIKKVNNFRSCL
ncbi:FHA domain-containing protein, partial [Candidatus Riflebacteria bacterium]